MTNAAVPESRSMPVGRLQMHRRVLEQAVAQPSPRRWLSRGTAGALAGGVVIFGGGAALAYVALAPATNQQVVRCYTDDRPGSGDNFHGTTLAQADTADGGTADIHDPVRACSQLWHDGVISAGSIDAEGPGPGETAYPVPTLSACVLDSGVAAVFPGNGDVCAELGLPALKTSR